MKILIYGAGVLGSIYAAHLQQAGHDVSILARGQRLVNLRKAGIVLEHALTGKRTTTHVQVVETLDPNDAYELVLVFVRKNQVWSILPALAANEYTPNVLFMVNNAAGPDAYIKSLGSERVLLGFAGAGGVRDGHLVRYVIARSQPVTLGELNGQVTPRLTEIVSVFSSAGFRVQLCNDMDAWLKTHVAFVSPIANALYMADGSCYNLAHTPDALILMVRAIREGFQVLRALDIAVIPRRLALIAALPEPILVAMLHWGLDSKAAEIALAGHANAARDEMQRLADEFAALVKQTTVATPAIEQLRVYLDPAIEPVALGHADTSMNFHSLILAAELLVGMLTTIRLLQLRRMIKKWQSGRRKLHTSGA